MTIVHLAIGLLLAALTAGAGRASELDATSQGLIRFASRSPSGPSELMAGTGKPVEIAGLLRIPNTGAGVLPAMVIAHGSGGISDGREHAWAGRLNEWGIASFVVDSFGPRGIVSTGTDQSQLPIAANVADAFAALALLIRHPRIDARRIGIIGFSKGGQVALYTALEPFRRGAIAGDARFAGHIALYASCSIPYLGQPVAGARILLLLGGADDYTPADQCARYESWLAERGASIRSIVFAGAHHGFDLPSPVRFHPRLQTARECYLDIRLEPLQGVLWKSGATLTGSEVPRYIRDCTTRGASFGLNESALAGAIEAVREEVSARLLSR